MYGSNNALNEKCMPKPEAYSEIHKRNITLDEAHDLYFSQIGERKRFIFRCGDPNCRKQLNPLVVGALYDRDDKPGAKPYTSYFREHIAHPHLNKCTWVENIKRQQKSPSRRLLNGIEGSVVSTNGLIFKLDPISANSTGKANKHNNRGSNSERPETSKFMKTIGYRYLDYTSWQKNSIPLIIEKVVSGTFFSVCRPLHTFHPHYQHQHIYLGRVKVVELSHVFLIKFIKKFNFDEGKNNPPVEGQIKLIKGDLDLGDLQLKNTLSDFAKRSVAAVCFFYSAKMPTLHSVRGVNVARFEILSLAHLSVIPA
jgi:hypothetical protein